MSFEYRVQHENNNNGVRRSAGEVMGIRLASGEELMGKYLAASDGQGIGGHGFLVLEKIRHIMVHRSADGSIGVSLMPWSFCNVDAANTINMSQIVAILQPDAEMVSNYNQQVTPIQLLS
jgi:hypothetical protein